MGQFCPWPLKGKRDEDLGTRTLLSFFHPRAQLDFCLTSRTLSAKNKRFLRTAPLPCVSAAMGWPGDSPRVPVLLQGQCSPGQGVISPHISTSRALPRNLLSCTHSCGGLSHGTGVQLLQWGQQGNLEVREAVLPQKQHNPTSLYPSNLLYPCVLSHYVPASGQHSLGKSVPPQRADFALKKM